MVYLRIHLMIGLSLAVVKCQNVDLTFQWSDNESSPDKVPLLKIQFPNGLEDVAVLKRFNPIRTKTDKSTPLDKCIYKGFLREEPTATVTLTDGCPPNTSFEIQFKSKRLAPSMFVVKDGIGNPLRLNFDIPDRVAEYCVNDEVTDAFESGAPELEMTSKSMHTCDSDIEEPEICRPEVTESCGAEFIGTKPDENAGNESGIYNEELQIGTSLKQQGSNIGSTTNPIIDDDSIDNEEEKSGNLKNMTSHSGLPEDEIEEEEESRIEMYTLDDDDDDDDEDEEERDQMEELFGDNESNSEEKPETDLKSYPRENKSYFSHLKYWFLGTQRMLLLPSDERVKLMYKDLFYTPMDSVKISADVNDVMSQLTDLGQSGFPEFVLSPHQAEWLSDQNFIKSNHFYPKHLPEIGLSLNIKLWYDQLFKDRFQGNSVNILRRVMAHTQHLFQYPSLGVPVILNLVGVQEIQTTLPRGSRPDSLGLVGKYPDHPNINLHIFFTDHPLEQAGLASVSWYGSACSKDLAFRVGVSRFMSNSLATSRMVASLIANSLGVLPDHDTKDYQKVRYDSNGNSCEGGLMDYKSHEDLKWSTCTIEYLEEFYGLNTFGVEEQGLCANDAFWERVITGNDIHITSDDQGSVLLSGRHVCKISSKYESMPVEDYAKLMHDLNGCPSEDLDHSILPSSFSS